MDIRTVTVIGATGTMSSNVAGRMLLDLYKQVTGTARRYQVKSSKNGLMLNIGGSATTNYVFIIGNQRM